MPSPQSLRRLANVTRKVHDDLRKGGMAITFKYLFRSTAILARVTAILADYVATEAGAPPDKVATPSEPVRTKAKWPNAETKESGSAAPAGGTRKAPDASGA